MKKTPNAKSLSLKQVKNTPPKVLSKKGILSEPVFTYLNFKFIVSILVC